MEPARPGLAGSPHTLDKGIHSIFPLLDSHLSAPASLAGRQVYLSVPHHPRITISKLNTILIKMICWVQHSSFASLFIASS
jgi:hypothetical protein